MASNVTMQSQALNVQSIVAQYGMTPLDEGGFYLKNWTSSVQIELDRLPAGFKSSRPSGDAILYLLPSGTASMLHRIPADEVWHFYMGAPLTLLELDLEHSSIIYTTMSHDILHGDMVQYAVKAGRWFGAVSTLDFPFLRPSSTAALSQSMPFSLVGCTMSPSFSPVDYELVGAPGSASGAELRPLLQKALETSPPINGHALTAELVTALLDRLCPMKSPVADK